MLVKVVAGCPLKVAYVVYRTFLSETLSSIEGLHLDCGVTAHRLAEGFRGAVLVKKVFELFKLE